MKNKEKYDTYFKELQSIVSSSITNTPSTTYWSFKIMFLIILFFGGLLMMKFLNIYFLIFYFYFLIVQLWFISHDIIHGHYFRGGRKNIFFSRLCGNMLIWLSHSWWMNKHNVGHHVFTNSDIHDTDIRDYDEIFTKNTGKSQFYYRYRKILFWFSLSLVYFNLAIHSYIYVIKNKKYIELFLLLVSFCLLPAHLMFYFWFSGLLWLFVIYLLVGIHLWLVFCVNHIWMEIIDGKDVKKYSWFDLQTRTSRNICLPKYTRFLFWWLDKQIEHHLFPNVPRNKIYILSDLLKEFTSKHKIKYHDVTFWSALKEIHVTLCTWKTR